MRFVDSTENHLVLITRYFGIRQYVYEFKRKWPHIVLAGMLDALTTIVALSALPMFELNPLVNHLFPEHVVLIPFLLVELTFFRYSVAVKLFQNSKYLVYAVAFTLYALPIWNATNILLVAGLR
ncbi:MAG: hypothetical protein AB1608_03265 [Thermoproteota archaeon]